jgi:DNA-binding Lrp family transcriptional regulator
MMKLGIIKQVTIDVDWSKVGLTTTGYIGSTTALGKEDVKKLFNFISSEPRIIEADTTIGAHEYFLKVIDLDIKTLRAEICAPLEPLTVDLTTSIITNPFKLADYNGLLSYLRKRILD